MKRRRHRRKNWDGHFYIQACSYIHTRLTHNCAFTQRPYHTNTLLHTDIIHTNTFTHRDAFTHKTLFDTQTPLHIIKPFAQSPFTHKHFYTQKKYTNMTPAAKHMQELIAKHATSLNSSRDTTLSQAGHTWSLLHTHTRSGISSCKSLARVWLHAWPLSSTQIQNLSPSCMRRQVSTFMHVFL